MRPQSRRQIDRWGARLGAAAGTALVLAIGVGLGILAVRLAHDVTGFLVVAAIVIVALAAAGALLRVVSRTVSPHTVLELDLTRPIVERRTDPLLRLGGRRVPPAVREVVEALDRAGADARVAGGLSRIRTPASGLAHAQELRDALTSLRARGKWAVAWGESFGEFAAGTLGYYVASACDEIALQPSGDVGLTGVLGESVFVNQALEKLSLRPRIDRRHEFKNAANVLTERAFTPAHREATERIVESGYAQIVRGVAAGRGLTEEAVRALVDRGPFLGAEAVEAKLVDRLGYRDEVVNAAKARAGAGAALLDLAVYGRRTRRRARGPKIALVHGTGAIRTGDGGVDPGSGALRMGSDQVSAALRAAAADRRVRAILFRVDSPGGSYVASDTIWRETMLARGAGKPVIVSMGNVAASGGYFVAMDADKIVAEPGTLTGSIGVLGGKLVTTGLRERLGLTSDEVHAGANATLWSSNHDYTPAGWDRLQTALDRIYADFTAKVAEGRGLPLDTVQRVARGRVWSGADAKELGLVDELGGFGAALRLVRTAIGEPADAPLRLAEFPRRRSLLARVRGERPESSDDVDAVTASAAGLADQAGPALDATRVLVALAGRLAAPAARTATALGLLEPRAELELIGPVLRW